MNFLPKWKYFLPHGFGPDLWSVWTWQRECLAGHPTKGDCERCQRGEWAFTLFEPMNHWLYENYYQLWLRWMNRPNSRARQRIEQRFPRLRS